jgi:single-strand DNA-binding protein
MDLNRVTLIGNLTKDPAAKSLPSGQAVSSFSLATNYQWEDRQSKAKKESVEFHDVVAFAKLAEIINQYVKKGSKIYLEGRLRTNAWKGRDGKTRRQTQIVADNLIMLGHRGKREVKAETVTA